MRKAFSSLVILMLLSTLPIIAQQHSSAARADLEFLIGNWIGEYETNGMKVVERILYEWDRSSTYLIVNVELEFGAVKDTGYGFMTIDSETGGLRSHMIAGVGMIHVIREVERSEDVVRLATETLGMPMGGSFDITYTRLSADAFNYQYVMGEGESAMELSVTYQRIKD